MTEKQKDIQKRIEEHYSDLDLNRKEVEQKVTKLLANISKKIQFEEEQIKQKVNNLLSNIAGIN